MRTSLTRDAIQLAIAALQRAIKSKEDVELRDNLDTAMREIADAVAVEGIQHSDPGITPEVMPLIIQLQLCHSVIQGGGYSGKSRAKKS